MSRSRPKKQAHFILRGYRDNSIIAEKIFRAADLLSVEALLIEIYIAKKFTLYAYFREVLSGFNTYNSTALNALKRTILIIMASAYSPDNLPMLQEIIRKHKQLNSQNTESLIRKTKPLKFNDLIAAIFEERKFVLYACVREASEGLYSDTSKEAFKEMILMMMLSVYDPRQLPNHLKSSERKEEEEVRTFSVFVRNVLKPSDFGVSGDEENGFSDKNNRDEWFF